MDNCFVYIVYIDNDEENIKLFHDAWDEEICFREYGGAMRMGRVWKVIWYGSTL